MVFEGLVVYWFLSRRPMHSRGSKSHRFTKVLKICPNVVDIVLIGILRHD